MNKNQNIINSNKVLKAVPIAYAVVRGSKEFNSINGNVLFYTMPSGTLVITSVSGLPSSVTACNDPIFAMHIHDGASCTGDETDPFKNAKTHYDPDGCAHPYHRGDLPPLFSANGYAFSATLTSRFTAEEIIGKTIIIHDSPDDFTTQPAGNSGIKIACGEILRIAR